MVQYTNVLVSIAVLMYCNLQYANFFRNRGVIFVCPQSESRVFHHHYYIIVLYPIMIVLCKFAQHMFMSNDANILWQHLWSHAFDMVVSVVHTYLKYYQSNTFFVDDECSSTWLCT